jgi:hypothetical protein
MAMNLLLLLMEQEITGIQINQLKVCITAYADDITIYLAYN